MHYAARGTRQQRKLRKNTFGTRSHATSVLEKDRAKNEQA